MSLSKNNVILFFLFSVLNLKAFSINDNAHSTTNIDLTIMASSVVMWSIAYSLQHPRAEDIDGKGIRGMILGLFANETPEGAMRLLLHAGQLINVNLYNQNKNALMIQGVATPLSAYAMDLLLKSYITKKSNGCTLDAQQEKKVIEKIILSLGILLTHALGYCLANPEKVKKFLSRIKIRKNNVPIKAHQSFPAVDDNDLL